MLHEGRAELTHLGYGPFYGLINLGISTEIIAGDAKACTFQRIRIEILSVVIDLPAPALLGTRVVGVDARHELQSDRGVLDGARYRTGHIVRQ